MPSKQLVDILHDFRQEAMRYHQTYEAKMEADPVTAQLRERIGALGLEKLGLALDEADTAQVDQRLQEMEGRLRARTAWLGLRPYQCSRCRDTGYVRGDFCTCVRRRIYTDYYGGRDLQGSGPMLSDYPLAALDGLTKIAALNATPRELTRLGIQVLLELLRDYPREGRGALLYGLAGVGKTYLALAAGREAVQAGLDVLFIHAADLHKLYYQQRLGEHADLYYLETSGLLIVDDLGTEPLTRNVTLEALNHLLQKRYEERISSRLYDPQRFTYLQLGGVDLRTGRIHKKNRSLRDSGSKTLTSYS